jgi:hypothetical protein
MREKAAATNSTIETIIHPQDSPHEAPMEWQQLTEPADQTGTSGLPSYFPAQNSSFSN